MKEKLKSIEAYQIPIIFGVILILAGFFINIPGGALTTYKSLNGDKAEDYVYDDKYSAIDEYVGGDAYNYIIGASLVAGKTSGAMISKTICYVGGMLSICAGLTMLKMQRTTKQVEKSGEIGVPETVIPENGVPVEADNCTATEETTEKND